MRKILFPKPYQLKLYGVERVIHSPDCRYAALAEFETEYVICRRKGQSWEDLIRVPKTEDCAELVAFNYFIDMYADAVVKKLQDREDYKKYIRKCRLKEGK